MPSLTIHGHVLYIVHDFVSPQVTFVVDLNPRNKMVARYSCLIFLYCGPSWCTPGVDSTGLGHVDRE